MGKAAPFHLRSVVEHANPTDRQQRKAEREQAKLERADLKTQQRAERAAKGPSTWRTVVLPILRVAVLAVIAIALVKFAFFPENAPATSDGIIPDGELYEPTVFVETGDIINDVALEGTIVRDRSQTVVATVQGEIGAVFVTDGDTVSLGDRLYQIRTEHEPEPVMPTEDEPDPVQPVSYFTYTDVFAPIGGTLTEFPFLVGMGVDIGMETGAILPNTFHIEAPITAAQQYRFTEEPEDATVSIADGPAPFTCTDVQVVASEEATPGSEGQPASTASIQCPVPTDVRVFPGLAAELIVPGGSAEGVPVLPTTAVIGTADTGIVFVPGADGEPEELEVGLGVNDGLYIEITSGLDIGDEVLQYTPGAQSVDCEDPETYDPLFCESEMWP